MQTLKKTQRFTKEVYTDEESSFISCPEYVAIHIASQASSMGDYSKAVELCSCIGAQCIQLANFMDTVVGIELSPKRIENARKNAALYGVEDMITFVQGDVLDPDLLKQFKADVVFLDPGWSTRKMDRSSHVSSIDSTKPSLRKMFELSKQALSENIVTRVPATFTTEELDQLGFSRIENIIINGELVFKVAYFIENLEKSYEVNVIFE